MKWIRRFAVAAKNPKLVYRRFIVGSSRLSIIELDEIERFLAHKGCIIEAGASDGVDTSLLSQKFKSHRIFAIEPVMEQYAHLESLLRGSEMIRVYNLALADKKGFTEINIGSDERSKLGGMGSSSLLNPTKHTSEFPQIKFNKRQRIETVTLHEFAANNKIGFVDLLWLDLQGLEYLVLQSSSEWIKKNVNCIHLELSRISLYESAPKSRTVEKFLKSLGFKKRIDRVGITSGNALFVNNAFQARSAS